MSYEGYTNHFCENGHYLGSTDAYEDNEFTPCFCEAKIFFTECIDLTNGCDDDCEDESCQAHSKVLKENNIIRLDKKNCGCNNGKITVTKEYKTGEQIEIDCPNCKGTSTKDEPVYDVSNIDYRKGII